jgi:hypothetical protein
MMSTRHRLVGAIVASVLFVAWTPPARAADDAAADIDDASDGASDAFADVASPDAGASPDAEPHDAAPDGPPPYDAGDGLTPLNELPTWDPEADNYGCSCRSVGGSAKAAAAGVPWMLAAFACLRRRRSRR